MDVAVNVREPFLTTVDELGVRTVLNLSEGESAVVKLPVHLISRAPLNVQVLDFKPNLLTLATSRAPAQARKLRLQRPKRPQRYCMWTRMVD